MSGLFLSRNDYFQFVAHQSVISGNLVKSKKPCGTSLLSEWVVLHPPGKSIDIYRVCRYFCWHVEFDKGRCQQSIRNPMKALTLALAVVFCFAVSAEARWHNHHSRGYHFHDYGSDGYYSYGRPRTHSTKTVHVKSYRKKDGIKVRPHMRPAPSR